MCERTDSWRGSVCEQPGLAQPEKIEKQNEAFFNGEFLRISQHLIPSKSSKKLFMKTIIK